MFQEERSEQADSEKDVENSESTDAEEEVQALVEQMERTKIREKKGERRGTLRGRSAVSLPRAKQYLRHPLFMWKEVRVAPDAHFVRASGKR